MQTRRSRSLFRRALRRMPGGVNSPVRAFGSVGGTPRFLERGKGARVFDVDGNAYLDYLGSWGPLILGHAHPGVLRAVRAAMVRGTSFGASTELEIELAELVCDAVPGVECIRMVNSGTEACMSAVRLARAATGRDRGGFSVIDLGEAWAEHTGLPFVYAVWVFRPGAGDAAAARLLREALAEGISRLDEIIAWAGRALPYIDEAGARDYLTNCIRYDVGAREEEGLQRFYEYLTEDGLAPAGWRAERLTGEEGAP